MVSNPPKVPPACRGNLKSAISSRREHTPQAQQTPALVMLPNKHHEKHPLAPPQPTARTQHLHRQVQHTPPHHQRQRSLYTRGRPRPVAASVGRSHQREPLRVRTQQTTCGKSNLPNALVSPRPSPMHSNSCFERPTASSHARTCRTPAIQPSISERREVGLAYRAFGEKAGRQWRGTQQALGSSSSHLAITKRWAVRSPRAKGASVGLGVQ